MTPTITPRPWRVQDELIEQPSWGGRYIIDMKGLTDDPAWAGKKVGQSYELAKESKLIDPADGAAHSLDDLIVENAADMLGAGVLAQFGSDVSLLIKLTQAKGNSFQVHLPEGKTLGHWLPKPEAWFYLGPGLYTFGLNGDRSFSDFSQALTEIDNEMKRLSGRAVDGSITVDEVRESARKFIARRNPYQYVNTVEAKTDDIVDLTAGGIHHSWEDDSERFPDGNLVYEVQVDVQDEYCSMRGFDKGKFLDNGHLRPTHVADYLATIERDAFHNDLRLHIRRPQVTGEAFGARTESLFVTPYFMLDRITLATGAESPQSAGFGFHHLFVFDGEATIGSDILRKGQSFFIPASVGEYDLTSSGGAVVLKTYLPVGTHLATVHGSTADTSGRVWPEPQAPPPLTRRLP